MATRGAWRRAPTDRVYDHVNLVECLDRGENVVAQVAAADEALGSWIDSPIVYFRPPFGSWSPRVAAVLNDGLSTSANHLGPIHWDIDAFDWSYRRRAGDPADCADAYLAEIESYGSGIVLNA